MKFRSKFEKRFAEYLDDRGVAYEYEQTTIPYQRQESKYKPDFELPNGVIVEVKGRFVSSDRSKHLLVNKQHPEYDIRFLFMNAHQKLYKGSKTTYAQWCDKHGLLWAHKQIPDSWLE